MLVESYDLLEAGKLAEAQKIYEQILKQDPGNPLALNNLGAIKVKENKYPEALAYLSQALPRAQGYKLKVNRVCDMQGLCLAFRPLEAVYGNQDLAPLVQLNLSLVKAKRWRTREKVTSRRSGLLTCRRRIHGYYRSRHSPPCRSPGARADAAAPRNACMRVQDGQRVGPQLAL